MVFSSTMFLLVFFPYIFLAYSICPRRARNGLLILASLSFYAWGEKNYIVLLIAAALGNWAAGLWIARDPGRRWRLTACIVVNLLALGLFKYANFLIATLNDVAGKNWPPLPVHLPAGVSFFTFQAISYLVDVARGDVPAERSLTRYSLYATLFPHLVAGPIVRYRDLSDQLGDRRMSLDDIAAGVQRFVVGLGKKLLLADTLQVVADDVFRMAASERTSGAAWLGLLCFSMQIYFDFSGYTDMAIGLGRVFGFHFGENFRYPYSASSLTDFWRRWHITLSSWLRDYVYIPLGGNRQHGLRNLFITFGLCGLWHGAAWTFVIWGLWHGLLLAVERRTGRPLGRIGTLLAVGCGWVVFRAGSLNEAGQYVAALAGFGAGAISALDLLSRDVLVALIVGALACVPFGPWISEQLSQPGRWNGVRVAGLVVAQTAGSVVLIVGSLMALAGGNFQPFLYFRF